jgi:aldoxime dehydratase
MESDEPDDRPELLEAAIPLHLQRQRTRPLGAPKDFRPKHASHSARFDASVKSLPIIYLGIQFPPGTIAEPAIQTIKEGIAGSEGPEFHDRASFVDEAGLINVVFALYWRDPERYLRWRDIMPDGWWHNELSLNGQIGAFEETFVPAVEDTETTFSHPHPEGYSVLSDGMSGKTDTHEYWSSARDRIPRAQTEDLAAEPSLTQWAELVSEETGGRLLRLRPQNNICMLRSGQDWSETSGAEHTFYLEEVLPVLEIGMREITEHGLKLGCCFNRYMQIADEKGVKEKTYSMSVWHSLANLEAWVRAETHLKIFGAGIRHYKQAGDAAKLKLYHEMMVLKASNQSFVYFNCHPRTGLLRTLPRL